MKTLLKELPELVAQKVISLQAAEAIERYYAGKAAPRPGNRLLLIFGVLGAALTGLGIILIFAHNWDTFSKPQKTLLAFLPLLLFQASGLYVLVAQKDARWREAAGILLFFAVGAAMALVAQIYNIPGDVGAYLCTWTLLCLPLIYLFRSRSLALLHMVFATWFAWEHNNGRPWMYLVFIAAFLPYYVQLYRRNGLEGISAILSLALPLSLTFALGLFLDTAYKFNTFIYFLFFGVMYLTSLLPAIKRHAVQSHACALISCCGMLALLLAASYKPFWKIDGGDLTFSIGTFPVAVAFFCIALYLAVAKTGALKRADPFAVAILAYPLIYFVGAYEEITAAIAANALVLIVGIAIIRSATLQADLRLLNLGLAVVSALVICRFFDTEMSFAVRGLLFMAVGGGFFAANYLLIRRMKKNETSK